MAPRSSRHVPPQPLLTTRHLGSLEARAEAPSAQRAPAEPPPLLSVPHEQLWTRQVWLPLRPTPASLSDSNHSISGALEPGVRGRKSQQCPLAQLGALGHQDPQPRPQALRSCCPSASHSVTAQGPIQRQELRLQRQPACFPRSCLRTCHSVQGPGRPSSYSWDVAQKSRGGHFHG